MKHSFSISLALGILALACSGTDRTEVQGPPDVEPAVLVDSIQWNGETISFYDASSEEGPEIVTSLLGRDREPELLVALERQLGRTPSAAELWLAAGGDREDIPTELLAAHEAQALEEGWDSMLERPDLDVALLEEKAVSQSVFNDMFPNNSDSTGVLPGGNSVCWNALATQVALQKTGKRVCNSNGNAIVTWNGLFSCDPVLNVDKTIRTGMNVFIGPGVTGMHCYGSGSTGDHCFAPVTVPPAFYYATSFFKSGTKHRLGTGAIWAGNTLDTTVILGSAELQNPGVPAFQSTTCTAH